MRIFIIASLAIVLGACGNTKSTVDEVTTETTEVIEEPEKVHTGAHINVDGVIVDKSEGQEGGGCGYVIEVIIEGKKMVLDPDSLPTKYQKDGAEVVISYDFSRRVSKCLDAMPIILSEIEDR